jgi:hypothetical protein
LEARFVHFHIDRLTVTALCTVFTVAVVWKTGERIADLGFDHIAPSEKVAINTPKSQSPAYSQPIDYSKDYSQPIARPSYDFYPFSPSSVTPAKPKQSTNGKWQYSGSTVSAPTKVKWAPKKTSSPDYFYVDTSGGNFPLEGAP